jgi:diguanylate cyclase (GGDEF)-like protein/PAS domain S-box-containing protein
MFHGVVNQSLVGIRLIEGERITYANAKTEEIFGLGPGESVGRDPADFVAESDRPRVLACVRATLMGESADSSYTYRGVREDGAIIDVEVHGNAIDIDARKILVSVIEDITERVRSVRELEALRDALRTESTHDALTGLYNRRYLEESLGRELRSAERDGHTVSVIMVDLDHFKAVNDHHGHLVGDAVLRKVGELVNRSARSSDICCRYGGEEFLVVLPGMSEQGALDRAEQLRIAIAAAPVSYGVLDIAMTASFGVSCFPSDARTSDELIGTADSALYAAKAAGRNRVNLASCSTHVGGTGRVARRVTTPDARTQEA